MENSRPTLSKIEGNLAWMSADGDSETFKKAAVDQHIEDGGRHSGVEGGEVDHFSLRRNAWELLGEREYRA
jgi:hypothetical protein